MRRFYFDRQTDVSGTSGTGAVVEGVQFSDGSVVVHWLTALSSISVYKSIEECIFIHGHDGSTNLHWFDETASEPHAPIVGGAIAAALGTDDADELAADADELAASREFYSTTPSTAFAALDPEAPTDE